MLGVANFSGLGQLEAYSVYSFLSDFFSQYSIFKIILNQYVNCVFCVSNSFLFIFFNYGKIYIT